MFSIYGKAAILFVNLCAFTTTGGPPKSFEQSLQEHHIALHKDALISALINPDPDVRWFAAAKLLVNDHALDTIALVAEVLAREKVSNTRLNIAWALAQVGDDLGFDTLQATCDDRAVSMGFRMKAARYMLDMNRESCVGTVIEALRGPAPETGLSLAPSFKSLPKSEGDEMFGLVVQSLKSPSAYIRIEASRALKELGRASAIANLQAAISAEQDDNVRLPMQLNLAALQQRSSH